MTDHQTVEAEYRMSLRIPQIAGLLAAVLGVLGFMLYQAITNDRGLVLQGILNLSRAQATAFWWAFSGLLGLGVLPISVAVAFKALFQPQRIAFAGDGVFLPASFWSGREIRVRFSDIEDLTLMSVRNEQVLTVAANGRKFRIGQSWLPSQAAFDDIRRKLEIGFQASGSARNAMK